MLLSGKQKDGIQATIDLLPTSLQDGQSLKQTINILDNAYSDDKQTGLNAYGNENMPKP